MQFVGKNVLITGASSGIGLASAEAFAAIGARLILTARRFDRLERLAAGLCETYGVEVLPLALDVQDRVAVNAMFSGLSPEWEQIDVLVNNAGLALESLSLQAGCVDQWETMIQTNVTGLLYMTKAVLPAMLARDCGHIINVSSIAGYEYYPGGNVYCATKHAVRALSKALRLDVLASAVRVSDVAPGAVATEFSEVRWHDKARADAFYAEFNALQPEDVADAIVYCATRPAHVDVAELLLLPTAQGSANHIHRA